MKSNLIRIAIALMTITISSSSYSDDFFYDYYGKKVDIRKIPNIYLLRTTVETDSIKTDLIKDSFRRYDPSFHADAGFLTIVASEASQDELESLEGIDYVGPGYVSDHFKYAGDIDTIFLSGLIVVYLKHPDGVSVLQRVAKEYHVEMLEGYCSDCFRLLCRNSSVCNVLQIANTLHELSIFDRVAPWFTCKTILGGGGGGSDGTLAVSKTSQDSPNIADITVRQTNRLLRITMHNQVLTSNFKVECYSIIGKRQKVSPIYHSDGTISVTIPNHLTAGLYIIRINNGKNRWEKRISVR
jgi:hypothetical protein